LDDVAHVKGFLRCVSAGCSVGGKSALPASFPKNILTETTHVAPCNPKIGNLIVSEMNVGSMKNSSVKYDEILIFHTFITRGVTRLRLKIIAIGKYF
jgi:hypothetical protein